MKMTVTAAKRNLPECIPECTCARTVTPETELYNVRFHLSTPTGPVIQAVDVTCDHCGKTRYKNLEYLGLTRGDLIL